MKKIVLYASALLFSLSGYAQQALWGGGDIVSPQINKDNSVTFRILAPKASKVEIEGDFLPTQKIKTPFGEVEAPGRVQLKEGKNGVWEYTSSVLPSEMYNYSVYVNDFKTTDPSNVYQNRDIATITNYFLIGNGQADLYMVQDCHMAPYRKYGIAVRRWVWNAVLRFILLPDMKAAVRNTRYYTCCMEPVVMKTHG